MNAFLIYRDRDVNLGQTLPVNERTVTQDLELNTLFNAMAIGDPFLLDVVKKAVLSSLVDLDTIQYRQNILRDCLNNPSLVRDMYAITVEAIEEKKKHYSWNFTRYPSSILYASIEVLQAMVSVLKKLRRFTDEHAEAFQSEGFTSFFTMLKNELTDDYFIAIQNHLTELKFRDGVLISARLGKGNKGTNFVLRGPQKKQKWRERVFAKKTSVYSFHINERDETGARVLSELRDRGINLVANALAQSNDHIFSFFEQLRIELGFYIGCLNLNERLTAQGEPISFPLLVAPDEQRHHFEGLYDVCLALNSEQRVIGTNVNLDHKDLVIITGANSGGKSTFLRSIGLAQLMTQCGMFVPAKLFRSNVYKGIFTHFKREEDAVMDHGKFDEELSRMSDIADNLMSDSLILFNESFAATNEREGSEIARQITKALLEKHVKMFFVTHLHEYAQSLYDAGMGNVMFLRAERQTDGTRTFKMVEGRPLQTSYGQDLYDQIFAHTM